MKIAVIGGAGAMGRWAVKELALSPDVDTIVVADVNEAAAKQIAAAHGGGKALTAFVDARQPESVRAAIAGCDALINCTQHFYNIAVMHVAAQAGVPYTDLGGLFHVTKEQLTLDEEFKKAGVTAVIAMGGAPGVTNLLAAYGAQHLDTISEAQALCGNVDKTDWSAYAGWLPPYSLETLCDEFSVVAPEFIDGQWREDIVGGSGTELVDFGQPAGLLPAHFTIHSEPITFWHAWRERGLRSATFKLSLPAEFTEQMRFLVRLGLTSKEEIEVDGVRVKPRSVLLRCVERLPRPTGEVVIDDVDYLLGVVRGTKDGRAVEWRVRATVPAHKGFGAGGGDVDTGVPPAIVAKMMARGEINAPGVFVPEQIVPLEPFFAEFARWGVTIDAEMRAIVAAPDGQGGSTVASSAKSS